MLKQLHKISDFRVLTSARAHISLLLLIGILSYSNTFNVPFVFDDNRVVLDSYQIKNFANLWPPSGTRWFGTLTFAINYKFGGLQVTGYHVVNLIIHLVASLLVYRLVALTFHTPLLSSGYKTAARMSVNKIIPFVAAFLFLSHPIQTQAVTYIAQRYASLATLFFIAAIVCYIQARLNHIDAHQLRVRTVAWYFAALLSAVLAMKTKEIAITLPFIVALYEYAFFPVRPARERFSFIIPMALTLIIIPATLASFGSSGISVVSTASDISRHDYLLTQFRVIVTYLRLLIMPVDQMIDYTYPVYKEFSNPSVFLSFALLTVLFTASSILFLKGRRGRLSPDWCLVGFGGLWFFITLSVESSVIPITDVIFEHRLYLPSTGFFIAATVSGSVIFEQIKKRMPLSIGIMSAFIILVLLTLPVATHLRNKVWRSGMSLWEDVASKSPGNARARVIIGLEYIGQKNIDKAIQYFKEAIRIKPDYNDAIATLGNAYMDKGMAEEGYQMYLKALVMGNMDFESRAFLMMNIGNYKMKIGDTDTAIYYYQQALFILPNEALIYFNLSQAYKKKGMTVESANARARARQLNPDRY